MFSAQWGKVLSVNRREAHREDLTVEVDGGTAPAVNYPDLTGRARENDRVLLNVTGFRLGLGTGGVHFVSQISGREERQMTPAGHQMKLRYTPWQIPVAGMEEALETENDTLDGMPVVVGELHSQLAPAVLAAQAAAGEKPLRIVYIMTDGGALPLAFSHQVEDLRKQGLIAGTITAGHAFGGDREAVTVAGGLLGAKWLMGADLAVVTMGPGIVGTGHPWGHSGLEQAWILDIAAALAGNPVAVTRISFADPRTRHRGLSHHSRVNLGRLIRSRVVVPVPLLQEEKAAVISAQLAESGISDRHELRLLPSAELATALQGGALSLWTMGRSYEEDREFFLAAAAAGWTAAGLVR